MMELEIDTKALAILANDLRAGNLRTKIALQMVMRGYVKKLEAEVIRNASGRPGPNVVTGKYIKTIKARRGAGSFDRYSISVGSDAPQAHRLEYGFVGQDSLGRMYAQPPFPHFRPALDKIEPMLVSAMGKALMKAWLRRAF